MKLVIFIILFSASITCFAQVEHNFNMSPEETDCHQIPDLKPISPDSAISIILNASYRFQEAITISRYRSPRKLSYFSCDGSVGYMVAQEDDINFKLYSQMPKTIWDSLANSNDPISFYKSSAIKQYQAKKPKK